MATEVIPLSQLQSDVARVIERCCDSGEPVVVELPDHRLVAIQPIDPLDEQDSLVSELIESNPAFRDELKKSTASGRSPFTPER